MKKVFYALHAALIVLIFFNSCATTSGAAKRITIASGEIPPDMANENFTIIGILHEKRGYDKWVEKNFAAYPGNSVTATRDELETTYRDVNKYRYVMDSNKGNERWSSTNASGRQESSNVITYKYYIKDRKTGKIYKRKESSSFFSKEIIAYLKAIDAVRKK